MMTDKTLIKMIGITKNFPGVAANKDVDFDLHSSEIHSILGENGAGKTTLMNILVGMHQPDAGTIIVRGQTVRIRSPRDSLRLGIGMVYQHFTLIPDLTVHREPCPGFRRRSLPEPEKSRTETSENLRDIWSLHRSEKNDSGPVRQ